METFIQVCMAVDQFYQSFGIVGAIIIVSLLTALVKRYTMPQSVFLISLSTMSGWYLINSLV